MLNLDYLCMKHGQVIGGVTDENNLRKALGVLQEDGVYAMFLWIHKKVKEEKKRKDLLKQLTKLLGEERIETILLGQGEEFPKNFEQFDALTNKLRIVAQDIDKLLFMKKVLERTLVYALYHAKQESNE